MSAWGNFVQSIALKLTNTRCPFCGSPIRLGDVRGANLDCSRCGKNLITKGTPVHVPHLKSGKELGAEIQHLRQHGTQRLVVLRDCRGLGCRSVSLAIQCLQCDVDRHWTKQPRGIHKTFSSRGSKNLPKEGNQKNLRIRRSWPEKQKRSYDLKMVYPSLARRPSHSYSNIPAAISRKRQKRCALYRARRPN